MEQNETYTHGRPMVWISSVDLAEERLDRIDWIVDSLIKPGLSVLAGAPKIGKSWMVLQLCLCVAKGEPFWGMDTRRGSVLYISLEDSKKRLQERLLKITDVPSEKLDIALGCPALGDELARFIADYCTDHTDARLIVIDTFQKIREQAGQMSYAGDYADVSAVKNIADQLGICILLVHHTRKLGDSDYINEISGTNGIAGSADTLMILKKEKRTERRAIFSCTGRDIEDREMELHLDRDTCIWQVQNDNYKREIKTIPPLIMKLIVYAGKIGTFHGTNSEFCELFSDYTGEQMTANHLKRMMNRYRYELEDAGVYFLSLKKNGERRLHVYYHKREDGLKLSDEDAAYEQAAFDMPPVPGDEYAPPVRHNEADDDDRFAYDQYR